MRRVLAAAVLVAFMPTANAQDKGKADFSTNAEYRARWMYWQNPGLYEKDHKSESGVEHRFKFNAGYKASEKVSANATFIYADEFGISDNTTAAGDNENDSLLVNEAYGVWRSSDDLNFKVGRMNYEVGDGSFISINDWEQKPYSFDGLQVNWEQEWGKLQFVAFKVRNIQTDATATPVERSASADPEHNMYGINFDLKSKPEWLKGMNAHIFKDNSDALDDGTGLTTTAETTVRGPNTNGLDTIRYGVGANMAFGAVDVKANYEKTGGKIKNINAGTKTEVDYEGDMMQAEVGFNLPAVMASRFYALYHKDSGDGNSTDKKSETYDPYYYDTHDNAGLMDLFGWGNLTEMAIGWTGKPSDSTTVGVSYHKFERTESSATAAQYNPGTNGGSLPMGGAANTKDDLGSEIDIHATHTYGNGLATHAIVGYFMPGDYFGDDSLKVGSDSQNDKQLYVMLQGKFTF